MLMNQLHDITMNLSNVPNV